MTSADLDRGVPFPEVYTERPIFLKEGTNGAVLYGMMEYRAGGGHAPLTGDEIVLSISDNGSTRLEYSDSGEPRSVAQPPSVWLEGVFRVTDVGDNSIDSPFFRGPSEELPIWGITVERIRDIDSEADIDRLEKAGIVAVI